MTPATPDPLAAVVMERISELWKWRAWYRQHNAMTLSWPVRWSNAAELRCLVKLAREARRVERDPYPPTMTYAAWTVREVDPEFNPGWVIGPGDEMPRFDPARVPVR